MNFYKLWEAIQHEEEKNSLLTNVLYRLSKEDCVRFALYCAEDVLQYNNEESLPLAQRCIDLIKSWLNDPKSVAENELEIVAQAAYYGGPQISAPRVAAYAAEACISRGTSYTVNAASSAAWLASNTGNSALEAAREVRSNRNKYLNLAKSFLSTTTSQDPMHKTFIQNPDISSIMAFLDHAEEVDENIVLHQNNEFIFNMPGHMIRAKNKGELAKKILDDRWAMNYLRRLYKV